MEALKQPTVAVLLATYNGSQYVETQINSLRANSSSFTLHWLDDHSTDSTREVVRASARNVGIDFVEWHQVERQGYPGGFFRLLECVEADIYLFCDQDDIWQPGKIDATATNLLPDIAKPALCFSHALAFEENEPDIVRHVFEVMGANINRATQESKSFTFNPAQGNTIGLTRPLRDIFLKHNDIARAYAPSHDWWFYVIALAAGSCRMISSVPTTLYRLHGDNISSILFGGNGWRLQQAMRRQASRQAQGFCLASKTLTPGPQLERLLSLARLMKNIDRRQSPAALVRLARRGALPPSGRWAIWLLGTCLFCNANT